MSDFIVNLLNYVGGLTGLLVLGGMVYFLYRVITRRSRKRRHRVSRRNFDTRVIVESMELSKEKESDTWQNNTYCPVCGVSLPIGLIICPICKSQRYPEGEDK